MKYAFTRNCFDNYEKAQFKGSGQYDIPVLQPSDYVISDSVELVRYDFSRKIKKNDRSGKGLHFFIDDYRFMGVWNDPDGCIDHLKSYDFVVAPDFSVYIDFPFALQVMAHYRRQWLAAYWQQKGVNVIPDVRWMGKRTL